MELLIILVVGLLIVGLILQLLGWAMPAGLQPWLGVLVVIVLVIFLLKLLGLVLH